MNFLNAEILKDEEWTIEVLEKVQATLGSKAQMSAAARVYGARETAEAALAVYPSGDVAEMAQAILAAL
jgi:hypothetical protein